MNAKVFTGSVVMHHELIFEIADEIYFLISYG